MPSAVPWLDVETMIRAGVGVRDTARRLGLSEERVKRQASRKGWCPQSPAAKLDQAARALVAVRTELCPQVPTAAKVLSDLLADDQRETQVSLSRAARRMARVAESAPLDQAGDALNVARLWEKAHRLERESAGPSAVVNIGLLVQPSSAVMRRSEP